MEYPAPFKPGLICQAIMNYMPETLDEMDLNIGDIVVIEALDETDEGLPQGFLKVLFQ
jgi:hypothetical protein